MLGAGGRPQSQELMVRVGEGSAPTEGDETRVANFGEDHSCTRPVAPAQRSALFEVARAEPGQRRFGCFISFVVP